MTLHARSVAIAEHAVGGLLLPALLLGTAVNTLASVALLPLLAPIAADLGTSVAMVGQITGATMLLATALGLVAGPLADRYGYRRMLLLGAGALVASAVGSALAESYAALLLAALVGALARAVVQPVSLTIAGSWFDGDARRRAIGLVSASVAGGSVLGVPLLGRVASVQGWRGAFAALALLGAASLLLTARGLPPDGPVAGEPVRPGAILAAYGPLLRDRPTGGILAASVLRSIGVWAMGTYLAAYLVEAHGLSLEAAGLSFAAMGAGVFLGSLAAGGRLGATPLRPLLVVSAVVAGALVGGAVLLPVPAVAVMALTFAGFFVQALGNVAATTLLATETRAGRATTLTLSGAANSLAAAVGGSTGGALLALGGYRAIGLAPPLCGVLASALVWWSRPRAEAGADPPRRPPGSQPDVADPTRRRRDRGQVGLETRDRRTEARC